VYLQLPGSSDFKFVGAVGVGKESAMFRVSTGPVDCGNPVVGISLEPEAAVAELLKGLPQTGDGGKRVVSTKVLAKRIIENAFNFLASFAGQLGPGGEEVIPLKSFREWWVKFEKRIEMDPGFLEREEMER
jgi:hypothetical protein